MSKRPKGRRKTSLEVRENWHYSLFSSSAYRHTLFRSKSIFLEILFVEELNPSFVFTTKATLKGIESVGAMGPLEDGRWTAKQGGQAHICRRGSWVSLGLLALGQGTSLALA